MNRTEKRYKRAGAGAFGLVVVCLLVLAGLSACSRSTPTTTATPRPIQLMATTTPTSVPTLAPTPTPQPLPDLQPVIDRALGFITSQYNDDLGLLSESPEVAPECYWLATDNLLATYALDAIADPNMTPSADDLRAGMTDHADVDHGMIEALVGEGIFWPPHDALSTTITTELEASAEITPCVTVTVKTETRNGDPSQGWEEYSDLALYGALNAYNADDIDGAQALFADAMIQFDGIGFDDEAFKKEDREDAEGQPVQLYATYKLALALIVGERLGHSLDHRILSALLEKQDIETGGFTTLYHASEGPRGDANTETTSYALFALSQLMQE